MFQRLFLYFVLFSFSITFAQSNVLINEFLSSNLNGIIDSESGEFKDWIEIYNPTDSLIDLSNYYLTDNLSDSILWQFPANTKIDSNSFLLLWADDENFDLHTNFKLDSDGEGIYLLNQDTIIVDSIIFGKQRTDVSYGRLQDSLDTWKYFPVPTPGRINQGLTVNEPKYSDVPIFSEKGGFYSSSFSLEITGNENSEIYYTIDGSIPQVGKAMKYVEPILIDSSTVIRAIRIDKELLPSKVETHSYFIEDNTTLPVISITSDPGNFWDDNNGIYTIGTNGLEFWSVKANYWQKWERPVTIEFFEEDKNLAFKMNAGIAISGARRNMLQKSFRIFARGKYGSDFINHKIFPDKEIRKFSSLVLRNGGYPEYRSTLIRDGFMQSLVSESMNLETQAYRPCIIYINGKYWGIYNIREKQNEEYLRENVGVDPENLDILENNMIVVEGTNNHYKNLINFIKSNDLSIVENYDSVKNWIDIDNYINYQIAQIYFANLDWPANNVKYWRPKTPEGKWRWLLFDVDAGFGLWSNYDFNSLAFATDDSSGDWNNPPWSTLLFRNLLKNNIFKNEFIQRFSAHLNYNFNPEDVISLIEEYKSKIEYEFPRHIERWAVGCSPSDPAAKDGCLFNNIDIWYQNIEVMKTFASERPEHLFVHTSEYFSLPNKYRFIASTDSEEYGEVFVNGVKAKFFKSANFFGNEKLTVEAKPRPGYKFMGWTGSVESSKDSLTILLNKDMSIHVIFAKNDFSSIPNVIESDLELVIENSPYLASSDIHIYENSSLVINEGVEIRMPKDESIYVLGNLNINGTKENPVNIKSEKNTERWGGIIFVNAKKKSTLSNFIIRNSSKGKDQLNQIGGISSYNSDLLLDGIDMDSVQFPIYVERGNLIMRNSRIHTDVVSDFINVKYGSAIIENCEFVGDIAIDTDAIDYDDVTYGVIRRNKIYNFLGDNSDAIDIGEGAKNVLIEENLIYNCSDKGISIGQESSAIIKGNIIANCNLGIGIKDDGSYGKIDHNTFYNNNIAVSCFEKILGRGGGKADISNSIFSNSISEDIFADEFSEINIKYSLSDTKLLDGTGNLFGQPEFLNADSLDFRVSDSSIAINNGDPDHILDPDGSRTNIGASYFDFSGNNLLVINEINYHSSKEFNTKDWIEFYNPSENDLDISNWIFKDSDDEHTYVFKEGTFIKGNDFIVLCEDSSDFKDLNPNINVIAGEIDFGINNSGENLRLFDNYGNIIDSLTFDDNLPWPYLADGEGYTLQLINSELDNSLPENWNASVLYGTPGEENFVTGRSEPSVSIPSVYSLSQNYPNPFNSETKINYSIPKLSNVKLVVYDILGRKILTLIDEVKKAGYYQLNFDSTKYNASLPSGVYFLRMISGRFQKTNKMILLK